MYTYEVAEGNAMKILTPWITDFSKIKKKIIKMPTFILTQLDYPNGLHLEIEEHANKIVFYSNMELKDNGDGTFTAPPSQFRPE